MDYLQLLVFLLIMYFLIRPLVAGFQFARPPRLRVSFFTPTNLGVTYEDVTLTSSDGVELAAWYIPSRNQAAIILLHGHSGNRLGVMHQAEALVKAGYGVLMYDLRAHGSSGGRRFARSQAGVDDLLTAVSYLSKRPEINAAGIGVMGVSVGGLFALQAAAQTVAIRAVVADGPSLATEADMPPATSLFAQIGLWQQRHFMQAARWFARHEPLPPNLDSVTRLGGRPLFLISTGQGGEAALVQQLADVAEAAMLWQIPEARHAQGWRARPDEYSHKLVSFFDETLVRRDNARIALPSLLETEAVAGAKGGETAVLPPFAYEATVSMFWANVMAFLMLPLAFVLLWLPYRWLWEEWPFVPFFELTLSGALVLILVFLLSTIVHELLHAVGFRWAGGVPFDRIKFGFSWLGLAPFAHCRDPLRAAAYRHAVLLPGLMLGVLPGLLGVALQRPLLVMWATLMLLAAGGDTAVLWAARKVPGNALVLDHPDKVGCQVLPE